MRRLAISTTLAVSAVTFGLAAPAAAGQGGVGPCTGGTPAALGTDPGPELGAVTMAAGSDPESWGFDSTKELVAFVHSSFCASNTPGG